MVLFRHRLSLQTCSKTQMPRLIAKAADTELSLDWQVTRSSDCVTLQAWTRSYHLFALQLLSLPCSNTFFYFSLSYDIVHFLSPLSLSLRAGSHFSQCKDLFLYCWSWGREYRPNEWVSFRPSFLPSIPPLFPPSNCHFSLAPSLSLSQREFLHTCLSRERKTAVGQKRKRNKETKEKREERESRGEQEEHI